MYGNKGLVITISVLIILFSILISITTLYSIKSSSINKNIFLEINYNRVFSVFDDINYDVKILKFRNSTQQTLQDYEDFINNYYSDYYPTGFIQLDITNKLIIYDRNTNVKQEGDV